MASNFVYRTKKNAVYMLLHGRDTPIKISRYFIKFYCNVNLPPTKRVNSDPESRLAGGWRSAVDLVGPAGRLELQPDYVSLDTSELDTECARECGLELVEAQTRRGRRDRAIDVLVQIDTMPNFVADAKHDIASR